MSGGRDAWPGHRPAMGLRGRRGALEVVIRALDGRPAAGGPGPERAEPGPSASSLAADVDLPVLFDGSSDRLIFLSRFDDVP